MNVFADTSAIFALLVEDDLMHNQAKSNFAYFAQNAIRLMSSSYVLIETVSLLQSRIGLNVVKDFHTKIFPLLDIVWVDTNLHLRAISRMLAQNKRRLSLTDCVSFEMMQDKGIQIAYTFDPHFEENGFTIAAY